MNKKKLVPVVRIRDEQDAKSWIKCWAFMPGEEKSVGKAVQAWEEATALGVHDLVGLWSEVEHPAMGQNWSGRKVPATPPKRAKKQDIKLCTVVEDRLYDDAHPALVNGDFAWIAEEFLN